jgi:hypothetical protein
MISATTSIPFLHPATQQMTFLKTFQTTLLKMLTTFQMTLQNTTLLKMSMTLQKTTLLKMSTSKQHRRRRRLRRTCSRRPPTRTPWRRATNSTKIWLQNHKWTIFSTKQTFWIWYFLVTLLLKKYLPFCVTPWSKSYLSLSFYFIFFCEKKSFQRFIWRIWSSSFFVSDVSQCFCKIVKLS